MPVFNKDVAMTAVGFEEEDVASRAAREGSSEGIHPLFLQYQILQQDWECWEFCYSWIPHCHLKQSLCCDWTL